PGCRKEVRWRAALPRDEALRGEGDSPLSPDVRRGTMMAGVHAPGTRRRRRVVGPQRGGTSGCGGAIGRYARRPGPALLGGAISHLLADLAPHRDFSLPIELPVMLSALGFLALRHGASSPAFLGAVGGVLPDVENGLWKLGVVSEEAKLFPTHSGLL